VCHVGHGAEPALGSPRKVSVEIAGNHIRTLMNRIWTFRFLIGGGCGIATVVTPLYLSETAPPLYKNRLGIANQSFIVLGVFLTQLLALFLSRPYMWRLVPLVSAGISVALLGSSLWADESHVWLQSHTKAGPMEEPMDSEHAQEIRPLIAS
jgi:MFS family permease